MQARFSCQVYHLHVKDRECFSKYISLAFELKNSHWLNHVKDCKRSCLQAESLKMQDCKPSTTFIRKGWILEANPRLWRQRAQAKETTVTWPVITFQNVASWPSVHTWVMIRVLFKKSKLHSEISVVSLSFATNHAQQPPGHELQESASAFRTWIRWLAHTWNSAIHVCSEQHDPPVSTRAHSR